MKVMLPEALADSEQRRAQARSEAVRAIRPSQSGPLPEARAEQKTRLHPDGVLPPRILKTQIQAELTSVQARFTRLVEQLCQVLGYLHGLGYVHRDIKPDNILFNRGSELKLIDFSLTTKAAGAVAKMLGSKEKTIQGTRTYIPPEAILKAPITPQSDIYSLGVTLFEVLTGDPPFRGSSPDDLLKKHLTGQVPEPSGSTPT